jgi:hypothetical protein
VSCLAGEKRPDRQGRDKKTIRGGKTDMQGIRVRQDGHSASKLSYERRIMPLKMCSGERLARPSRCNRHRGCPA